MIKRTMPKMIKRPLQRILFVIVFSLAGALAAALAPSALRAQSCESLAKLSSPAASITLATTVAAGAFAPASATPGQTTAATSPYAHLPAFCRVAANFKPTPDSDIHAEIWLPLAAWNGKFVAVGSGGWGGYIGYADMADVLAKGYATCATDDGHAGHGSASFILGHPEKFVDFAYRSEHEMTVEAKILIKAFYGREARYSYWSGCSGGGREGLLQAYRYPDEFNGIVVGDPANIRRNAWALWLANQTFKDPAAVIPPAKYPMIHRYVLDACDANDGLKDGLIENPERCHVDFKALECNGPDAPTCLTARQVQSAQTILSPATAPNGDVLFPRLEPGTELRWARLAGGPVPADLFLNQYRYVVYQDPNWDWRTFDLARDAAKEDAVDKDVDDINPHLAPFAKHGGKLLIYHGWADQQVAPGSSIEFYKSAAALSGDTAQSSDWIRLFMVPGMAHCWGGEGPDTFDKIGALEEWVEQAKPPSRIIASHFTAGHVDRTRPLCPYPQVARYKGAGSIDDAANFACVSPTQP
jgi:feruloyl esterase